MSATAWDDPTPATVEAEAVATAEEGGHLGRNLRALASGQLITWSMTLLWTLIVPRALGPSGLGLVVSAMSVAGVFGIVLGLGTRTYLVREIVVDRAAAPKLVGTGMVLRLVTAPLFAIGIFVWAQLANYGQTGSTVLYLVALATVLTLLAEPMQAGFQGIEQMKYLAYSDVLNKSSQGLIGIAVVLVGFRAVGIAANMAAVAAVVVVLNVVWLSKFFRIDLRTNWQSVVRMARRSLPYWTYGVFGMIYLWIDTMMLSLLTKPEVVGWYGAPTRLFQTLMFAPVLLSTAWLPRLISAYEESPERLLKTARRPVEFAILVSVPICAGTAVVAGYLVPILYGSAFDHAVPVMIILGLCLPPMYANIMLASVLLAANRQMSWTWVMVGAAVFNPLVNLVLIPWTQHHYGNGAVGAAISLLLTELIMVAYGFRLVGRRLLDATLVRRSLGVIAASVGMWAAAYVTRPLGPVVSIGAGCLTFAILVLALRVVGRDEIELARGLIARRRAA